VNNKPQSGKEDLIMILLSMVNRVLAKILFWREIYVERTLLSKMSDDLLKDIGISKAEADQEANRPFWDTSSLKDMARLKRHIPH
jgi:uncharacterized protein YjiS (DUF1127 family)